MLNTGQQLAEVKIKQILTSAKSNAVILSAPAGYGKTFLLKHIMGKLDAYNSRRNLLGSTHLKDFHITATTNKAASLLPNAQTINKLLGLALKPNATTGKRELQQTNRSTTIADSIICIDEYSMLSNSIMPFLLSQTERSKFIFVGDTCQLNPVSGGLVKWGDVPVIELTEPMRQDINSHLFKELVKVRNIVKTGNWTPITAGEGITCISPDKAPTLFNQLFTADTCVKVITYTNARAKELNGYIRKVKGLGEQWTAGEDVTVRTFCKHNNTVIPTETVTRINYVSESTVIDEYGVEHYQVGLEGFGTFPLAVNHVDVTKVLHTLKGNWGKFYEFKEKWLDLRSPYAGTAYTAQGSSYDTVIIDLNDMRRCTNKDTLARMLYVAFSRARTNVYLLGHI